MKILIVLFSFGAGGIILSSGLSGLPDALAQEGRKPKDEYILGPYAKLGGVKFSHIGCPAEISPRAVWN